LKNSKDKERAVVFKLILLRPESFFNFQDELKEETSVDADHEKQNFHRNIDEKQVSTILTNSFDKNFPCFFMAWFCPVTLQKLHGADGPE
jgi:hypothetical protein